MNNKKVLILLIILLISILMGGILLYTYLIKKDLQIEAPIQQDINKVSEQKQETQLQGNGIEVEVSNGGNMLFVCADECGNGICQDQDNNCKNGDLNCVCIENIKECPEDCK